MLHEMPLLNTYYELFAIKYINSFLLDVYLVGTTFIIHRYRVIRIHSMWYITCISSSADCHYSFVDTYDIGYLSRMDALRAILSFYE